jgi:hypothetical protein
MTQYVQARVSIFRSVVVLIYFFIAFVVMVRTFELGNSVGTSVMRGLFWFVYAADMVANYVAHL